MCKFPKNIFYDSLLVIIIFFTIVSTEYTNFIIANQDKYMSKTISSVCVEDSKSVKIKITIKKKEDSLYQITLVFDNIMRNTFSFICSHNIIDSFWDDPSHFNIIIESKDGINNLSIIVNPKGYNRFFATKCNKKLLTQVLFIK